MPVIDVLDMMNTVDDLDEMNRYHIIDTAITINMNQIENPPVNLSPNRNLTISPQTKVSAVGMTIGDQILNRHDREHCSFRMLMGDRVISIVMIFHVAPQGFHNLLPVV
jgi:hypothetical protein